MRALLVGGLRPMYRLSCWPRVFWQSAITLKSGCGRGAHVCLNRAWPHAFVTYPRHAFKREMEAISAVTAVDSSPSAIGGGQAQNHNLRHLALRQWSLGDSWYLWLSGWPSVASVSRFDALSNLYRGGNFPHSWWALSRDKQNTVRCKAEQVYYGYCSIVSSSRCHTMWRKS